MGTYPLTTGTLPSRQKQSLLPNCSTVGVQENPCESLWIPKLFQWITQCARELFFASKSDFSQPGWWIHGWLCQRWYQWILNPSLGWLLSWYRIPKRQKKTGLSQPAVAIGIHSGIEGNEIGLQVLLLWSPVDLNLSWYQWYPYGQNRNLHCKIADMSCGSFGGSSIFEHQRTII